MASTLSIPALADSFRRTYGFEAGEQAISQMSRVVIDNDGDAQFIADDLPTTLSHLLASAGAAAAIAAVVSGEDLTAASVLDTLADNVSAHATEGADLFASLVNTTGAASAINLVTDIVSTSTPIAAGTVTASASQANETVNLTPAGTLATLSFTFPANTDSRIGQILRLTSTQIVTALTVSSSGLTLRGTAVTALAVNTPVVWLKVSASTWLRLS